MAILNVLTNVTGLVGVNPNLIYIDTNNTIDEVTTAGYLNEARDNGFSFSNNMMAMVNCRTTPSAQPTPYLLRVTVSAGTYSLVNPYTPGAITTPTVANRIPHFTDTGGSMSDAAANVINLGNITAGSSGTAGILKSYPAGATSGYLALTGVASSGDYAITISNASHGQASVYSIPDSGASTANFIVSKLSGTQHITVGGLAVDAGILTSGISTGGTAGGLTIYPATTTTGSLKLVPVSNVGNYATTISNITGLGQAQVITIPDAGASTATFLLSSNAAGQSVSSSSSSATPGTIRALKGLMTLSNATYANTTNSVAGVRGEVDLVGASSGYVYGVQGKVTPTGTLSGSIWAPAVFGQYDLSGATINAGQIAAIWGDMGATGGTFTDVTGARMFAGTNTIASLTLNSMIYLYGKATNLLELSGSSSTYIAAAGGVTPSGTNKTIAITIDGTTYYILASTVYS